MFRHWLIEYRTYTCKEIKFYIRSISERMSTYQHEVDISNIYTSVDAMMATPNNLCNTPQFFSRKTLPLKKKWRHFCLMRVTSNWLIPIKMKD